MAITALASDLEPVSVFGTQGFLVSPDDGMRDAFRQAERRQPPPVLNLVAEVQHLIFELNHGQEFQAREHAASLLRDGSECFRPKPEFVRALLLFAREATAGANLQITQKEDVWILPESGERVFSLEELAQELDVATRTLKRWASRGLMKLPMRRGARAQESYLESHLQAFLRAEPDLVLYARSFSRMTENDREMLLARAREFGQLGARRPDAVAGLAEEFGRSRETVRSILAHYEREHPEAPPLFIEGAALHQRLMNEYRNGASLESLAARYKMKVEKIAGGIAGAWAGEMRVLRITYQPLPDFEQQGAYKRIVDAPYPTSSLPRRNARCPKNLPHYLASLYDVPLLEREQEAYLFKKYNYLKYAACVSRDALPETPRLKEVERVAQLLSQAETVRTSIVEANLRLAVSLAKRYAGQGVVFDELVSDANMSLYKAVEKFDVGRGFKFSTYAYWTIVKNFNRAMPIDRQRRARERSGQARELLEAVEDSRSMPADCGEEHALLKNQVAAVLQLLDPREQEVIQLRFGLGQSSRGKFLREVGSALGVTKERIRQIESQALTKLLGISSAAATVLTYIDKKGSATIGEIKLQPCCQSLPVNQLEGLLSVLAGQGYLRPDGTNRYLAAPDRPFISFLRIDEEQTDA